MRGQEAPGFAEQTRDVFADLGGATTFWVVAGAALVLGVLVLVAGARPPRWLRARRKLDEMFAAARAEQARVLAQVLAEARARREAGQS